MTLADDQTSNEYLDRFVEAARQQFGGSEIERAAQRFRARLPRGQVRRRARFGWLTLGAAASVVVAAVTVVSVLLPGQNGSAFAQAQQWFSTFRTLHIETTAQIGQEIVSTTDLWLNDAGDVRIEAGGLTTIVRAGADTIYVTMPDGQVMAQSIPPTAVTDETIGWLDQIRGFEGEADLLPETRLIDGVSAIGYAVTMGLTTLELWIDPFDGKPLLVEATTPEGTSIRHALSFDVPLPTNAFDVPDTVQSFEQQ